MGVASLRPDNMSQGGLPSDFTGKIARVRFEPFDYDGRADKPALAIRMEIEPDADSGIDPFFQHYSAGDLAFFHPSMDGKSPVDVEDWKNKELEDVQGIYAFAVSKREQLAKTSNYADFVQKAIDVGFPIDLIGSDCRFLEGTRGHFQRVPQQKRSGQADDGKKREILVLTRIDEIPGKGKAAAGAKAAPKAAAKAGAPAEAASGGDNEELDNLLDEIVIEAISNSEDGIVPKSKLAPLAMAKLTGANKQKGVKRIASLEYLTGRELLAFDAETNTVTLAG